MKGKVMPLAAIVAAVTFIAACNNNNDDNNAVNTTDKDYVLKAALSNTAEISAANIALSKSTDDSVRMFAQMMVTDHGKAQDSLKQVASQLGLYAPDSVDAAHAQEAAMLQAMPAGRAFDSAYTHGQVTDHQVTLALFQNEASAGNNGTVKGYEAQYVDVIQMHLTMSTSMAAKY